MVSSTLLYIAWPVTLGLSFIAGGMILSKGSSNEGSQVSQINASSHGYTNEKSTMHVRHSSSTRSLTGKQGHARSYDIKEIANTSDPKERMTKFLLMIDQLGPGDFEQALATLLESGMNMKRMVELQMLLNAWAKINPEGALAYANENTKISFITSDILSAWAGYAPDAAIQWVEFNDKGDKTSPYLVDIIIGITQTNPQRATNMLQELPYDRVHEALHFILPHVSKLGTEKAIAWLATIKDETLHAGATRMLAASLATKDPQGTIDWLQTFPADEQKTDYAETIARAWAELDIKKAAEWTSSLGVIRRSFIANEIIHKFASSDPNKAATWMKTMSDHDDYTHVVYSFFNAAERDHPEVALANLDQVADKNRNRYKNNVLRIWAIKDKGAATKWMQSNNMAAAAQEKVLSAADKGVDRHKDRRLSYFNMN